MSIATIASPTLHHRYSDSAIPNVKLATATTRELLTPAPLAESFPISQIPKVYGTRDRIPNAIYYLFSRAPKNEIHVHQGGSSSIEFLNYRLRMAVEKNQQAYDERMAQQNKRRLTPKWVSKIAVKLKSPKQSKVGSTGTPGNGFNSKILDEFPVFQPNAAPKMVRFTDTNGKPLPAPELRAAMEEAFTAENLRTYYRYAQESDNQKAYMDSNDLAETTATHDPHHEMITATESAELQRQKDQGLQAYRKTSAKINPVVKNLPAFYKLANEYAYSMPLENVRYTEYRISPSGNGIGGANGSNIEDVLSEVHRGFENARKELKQRMRNLDYGLIVLMERQNRSASEPPDAKVKRAVQLAKDVVRLKEQRKYNICGVDLAGDEAHNSVLQFKEAFDIIKAHNLRMAAAGRRQDVLGITIHAGETPESKGPDHQLQGWQSIEHAVDMASDEQGITPVRIGHGLQIINSSDALKKAFEKYCQNPGEWNFTPQEIEEIKKSSPLLRKIIDRGVVLEMCPKSNLQTYGIHPGFPNEKFSVSRDDYSAEAYKRHPAVFLTRLGVKVAISSDNRTISNTDVTNEFVKLFKYAGLTYGDFKKMVMNGFDGAFIADPAKKAAVIQDVESQFAQLEQEPEYRHAAELMGRRPALDLVSPSAHHSMTPIRNTPLLSVTA